MRQLFVNTEFTDTHKCIGVHLHHAFDMIDCIHISRVETGYHRIKALFLLITQLVVLVCHHRIIKRVVVEMGIRVEIISRSTISGIEV